MTAEQQQDVRYLTRAEVEYLAEKLDQLPEIERELAIALTGQTRSPDTSGPRSQPRSRPPYPVHIEVLLDELKAKLVTAVRDVEQTRGIVYESGDTITACGVWLKRHRVALQMMATGVKRFDSLCTIIDRCSNTLGRNHVAPLAPAEKAMARSAIVTASTIETVAKRVGAQGLNDRRLRLLAKRGAVRSVSTAADGSILYRLGDVLDAHRDTPRRGGPSVLNAPPE